ncbi:hypothetical protein LTR05_007651 [Lithohypha guttulata]|uniref:Uncharacterized protein n=1 Tax=Lithohypha guttulata TaxID=1690604 RepID=A0AAN7SU22_9EURO|nr:hypothetical protein LTR05_007651 [Lithohypha guttulata]
MIYSGPNPTMVSRKRPRVASHHFADNRTPRASGVYDLNASVTSLNALSPSPLANSEYRLWGGMDTPGALREQRLERMQEADAERDYRQSRFAKPWSPRLSWRTSDEILNEETKSVESPPKKKGWSLRGTAWALTGGVVGTIFNFCWNTTFSGFQAGGGEAYTNYAEVITRHSPEEEKDDYLSKRRIKNLPGTVPRNRKSLEQHEALPIQVKTSTTTPTKFVEYGSTDSVVKDDWVFLEHNTSQEDLSPARKRSKASVAGSSRYDSFQPVQPVRSSTASYASSRSRTSASANVRSHNGQKRSSAALTSPTLRQVSTFDQQSPASPEIEHYQRKKRREVKRQDESIRRLNSQLQDMIREGQEALGSKIEIVDDNDTDEGFFEDEYLS